MDPHLQIPSVVIFQLFKKPLFQAGFVKCVEVASIGKREDWHSIDIQKFELFFLEESKEKMLYSLFGMALGREATEEKMLVKTFSMI